MASCSEQLVLPRKMVDKIHGLANEGVKQLWDEAGEIKERYA